MTLKPVSAATISLVETGRRTSTDEQGHFAFETLWQGHCVISVHHLAYADVERKVFVGTDRSDSVVIALQPVLLPSDEVIVRSLRTSSDVGGTPFASDVQLADRLARRPELTLPEALEGMPGLSLVRDGAWETALSIRGLSRSNIVTLIDNTRIETANDIAGALSLINVADLDRAEVLKSSGSVLYGSGALGGVVHLLTKRPQFSELSSVSGEVSSGFTSVDDGTSQYLAVEGSTDRYAARFSGAYGRAENTMTPRGILPGSHYRDFHFTGMLGIKPVAEQTLFLSYQRSQAEDAGIPGGAPIGASASARYTLARRQLFAMDYSMPHIIPWFEQLTLRASHQRIDRNVEILQKPGFIVTPHAVHATTSLQIETESATSSVSVLTTGVEVWRRQLDSKRERDDRAHGQLIGERPLPRATYTSAGIYAQNEWSLLNEQLTLTLGTRFDWIRVANEETWNPEYIVVGGVRQSEPAARQLQWHAREAGDRSWSADAGARYAISPEWEVAFLTATAFRSPSLEERFQYLDLGGIVYVGNPELAPERSLCVNTGIRFHDSSMKFRGDLFLNTLENLVTAMPGTYGGRPAYISTNVGRARLYGFEFSAERSLASWSSLRASFSFVRGKDIYQHIDLPQIPPFSGEIEMLSRFGRKLSFSLTWELVAAQRNVTSGEKSTPGHGRLDIDGNVTPLADGPVSLTLRFGVANVLNQEYQNHLSTLRGLVTAEPGRNFHISASAMF